MQITEESRDTPRARGLGRHLNNSVPGRVEWAEFEEQCNRPDKEA